METWRIHQHDDGWYFEDDFGECFGPYKTSEEAEIAHSKYARYIEGNCPNCGEGDG